MLFKFMRLGPGVSFTAQKMGLVGEGVLMPDILVYVEFRAGGINSPFSGLDKERFVPFLCRKGS